MITDYYDPHVEEYIPEPEEEEVSDEAFLLTKLQGFSGYLEAEAAALCGMTISGSRANKKAERLLQGIRELQTLLGISRCQNQPAPVVSWQPVWIQCLMCSEVLPGDRRLFGICEDCTI